MNENLIIGGPVICQLCGKPYNCREQNHICMVSVPQVNEKAVAIPEDHCWYCDQAGTDHKHGNGRSCGDCCGMHGSLNKNVHAYKWVKECLSAKNERIAALQAEVDALKWQPITPENLPKVGDEVLRHRMGVSGELHIATESVVFSDTNIDDYKMLRCTHFRPINPPTLARATPPQDVENGGKQ